jgi:DNA-directed RNA polymerase subunit RPC12/RpoP
VRHGLDKVTAKKELSPGGALWNGFPGPMTEFKFACPVCGQHITTASSASGGQIECPTCFRRIVVPQAPASDDTKLILSATQVHERPSPAIPSLAGNQPARRPARRSAVPTLVLLGLLGLAAVCLVLYRREFATWVARQAKRAAGGEASPAPAPAPPGNPPAPKPGWSLNLADLQIPDKPVAGRLHGRTFTSERATLTEGRLSLRQGTNWPPELGVSIHLFALNAESLGGKTVEVTSDRVPPLPRVVVRWKNEKLEPLSETISNGYALKLNFGGVTNGRIPGRLYLCLPDNSKSYVAGSFEAEIRKRPPARPPATPAAEETEKP